MRDWTFGVVVGLLMGAAAGAQTSDPQLIAPIQKSIDSFNKGDMAGAAATHAAEADLVIIDEVPPFLWRGAPTRTEMSGDQAYVVTPAVYTFKERGVAMRDTAQMTFALRKGPGGWLIHGWTWTGPKPTGTAKESTPK